VPDGVLEQYREEWEKLDPKGSGNIASDQLMVLLRRVRLPLGFQIGLRTGGVLQMTRTEQLHFLDEVQVPDHAGYVNFQELLQCLTRHAHRELLVSDSEASENFDPSFRRMRSPQDLKFGQAGDSNRLTTPTAEEGSTARFASMRTRMMVPALPPHVTKKLERELKAALRSTHAHDLSTPRWTQAELHAALLVQAAIKGQRLRRAIRAAHEGATEVGGLRRRSDVEAFNKVKSKLDRRQVRRETDNEQARLKMHKSFGTIRSSLTFVHSAFGGSCRNLSIPGGGDVGAGGEGGTCGMCGACAPGGGGGGVEGCALDASPAAAMPAGSSAREACDCGAGGAGGGAYSGDLPAAGFSGIGGGGAPEAAAVSDASGGAPGEGSRRAGSGRASGGRTSGASGMDASELAC